MTAETPVAFIGHLDSLESYCSVLSAARGRDLPRLAVADVEPLLRRMIPMPICDCEFRSLTGASFMCRYIDMYLLVDETFNMVKAAKRVLLACEETVRCGAKLGGLGGFSSIVGESNRFDLPERFKIAFTTGNTYTSAVVAHQVRELAGPPGDAVITIVGASGDVGSGACRVLHEHGYRPVLVARNQERLHEFAQTLPGTRVMTWEEAAPITDIAVLVAGTSKGEISLDAVPRDAYILDVGHPHNADGQGRARYAVAGRAAFVHHPQIEIPEVLDLVCRPGETHACLAETVILGFEQRWESYSMGRGNITPDKVRELLAWGERHGVAPAPLHFGIAHHGAQHAAHPAPAAKDAAHG